MVPDSVWRGSILTLGSRLVGVSPTYWVVARITRVGFLGEPYWSLSHDGRGEILQPSGSYEAATLLAGAVQTMPTVYAVAIVGCDRPPPPVPSGEDSTGADAAVVWLGEGRAVLEHPQRGAYVGRGQLVTLISDLYAPAGIWAGKGGRHGQ